MQELLLKILKNTEAIETRLNYIENDFSTRLQNVENVVTKIEKEHGDKLQILFDYFVDQDKKEKATKSRIKKNEETLDEHDTRLFALEFHKEKLASN